MLSLFHVDHKAGLHEELKDGIWLAMHVWAVEGATQTNGMKNMTQENIIQQ